MELSRMICRYNREGKGVFDQFYLDEDLNVPDAKEDVKQMIESSAEVKVEDLTGRELREGFRQGVFQSIISDRIGGFYAGDSGRKDSV